MKWVSIEERLIAEDAQTKLADNERILQAERVSKRTLEDKVEWFWRLTIATEHKK